MLYTVAVLVGDGARRLNEDVSGPLGRSGEVEAVEVTGGRERYDVIGGGVGGCRCGWSIRQIRLLLLRMMVVVIEGIVIVLRRRRREVVFIHEKVEAFFVGIWLVGGGSGGVVVVGGSGAAGGSAGVERLLLMMMMIRLESNESKQSIHDLTA